MAFKFELERHRARFKVARRSVAIVLILFAYLYGAFEEVRRDDSGWCAHFNGFMVCNDKAITDYTLGE
jgi:hypothetical protein